MPFALTVTDLLVVAFLVGFGCAALVFWPMVRRARHRLAAQRASAHSLSVGKYALREPSALKTTDSTTASATAVTILAAQRRTPVTDRPAPTPAPSPEPSSETPAASRAALDEQANADLPTAPQPRITESIEMSPLPTDLYERHYEVQFERARKRIERLRAQLNER
jgi:hypothetical protein